MLRSFSAISRLGHVQTIERYLMNHNECASNDLVMSWRGKMLKLFNSHIQDWRVTFADTGIQSQKLIDERQLIGHPDGASWTSFDTVKDKQQPEGQWGLSTALWKSWESDCNETGIPNIAVSRETPWIR